MVLGISHDLADFRDYLEHAASFSDAGSRVVIGTTETVAGHPSPSGQMAIIVDNPHHNVSHVRDGRILTFLSAHVDKVSYKPVAR